MKKASLCGLAFLLIAKGQSQRRRRLAEAVAAVGDGRFALAAVWGAAGVVDAVAAATSACGVLAASAVGTGWWA